MIVSGFIGLFAGLQTWFVSLFGTDPPPAWMGTAGQFLGSLIQSARGLGPWVPWTLILTIAAFNLTLWAAFLAIKVARWVLGLVPTMGGG